MEHGVPVWNTDSLELESGLNVDVLFHGLLMHKDKKNSNEDKERKVCSIWFLVE